MAAENKMGVMIIDDEMLAREKIRTLLRNEPDIKILEESKDGRDAVSKIKSLKPDLIFLDIQMPGMDGFEVIRNLRTKNVPAIIFTTAYDKYAIKAFEIYALDYLLKPFDKERFQRSLERARNHLSAKSRRDNSEKIFNLLKDWKKEDSKKSSNYLSRMVIKSAGRIFFLNTDEINRIEASGNYLRLFTENESHLIRDTMNALEKKLNPADFVRIHRSLMINVNFVKEFKPWFHGEFLVYLKNGIKLTSSRTYRDNLLKIYQS